MPAGVGSQHTAQHANQPEHGERHQRLDRIARETRPLDLRQHERRAQEYRRRGRQPAAHGAEAERRHQDGRQIGVAHERGGPGAFERDQDRHRREGGRDQAHRAPSVRYAAKKSDALTSPGTRLSDHHRSQQLVAPSTVR